MFRTNALPKTMLLVLASQLVVAPPTPSSRVSLRESRARPSLAAAVSVIMERSAPVSSRKRAGFSSIVSETNIRFDRVSIGKTAWRSNVHVDPESRPPAESPAHPAKPSNTAQIEMKALGRIRRSGRTLLFVIRPTWVRMVKIGLRLSSYSSAGRGSRADIPRSAAGAAAAAAAQPGPSCSTLGRSRRSRRPRSGTGSPR